MTAHDRTHTTARSHTWHLGPDIKSKAARLGEVLRSDEEDGVRVAAKWLDMYSRETRTAPTSSDQPEPHMRWIPDEEVRVSTVNAFQTCLHV